MQPRLILCILLGAVSACGGDDTDNAAGSGGTGTGGVGGMLPADTMDMAMPDAAVATLPPDPCTAEKVYVCDGLDVVSIDPCTDARETTETCSSACYQAECVACAPNAGIVCEGSEVWRSDSCGMLTEQLEVCSGRCGLGACIPDSCTLDDSKVCSNGNVVYQDSCGNPGRIAAQCDAGCTAGVCDGCTPGAFTSCHAGDVWSKDSCRNVEAIEEVCDPGSCLAESSGGVVSVGCDPTATNCQTVTSVSLSCFDGHLYLQDTCGGTSNEIYMECESGCEPGVGCMPCEASEVGRTCSGNDVVRLIGGCSEGMASVGDVVETCPNGCGQGTCLPAGCTPNAGVTCVSGNSYAVDSCGTQGDLIENCVSGCELGHCIDCTSTTYECQGADLYKTVGCADPVFEMTCPEGCTGDVCNEVFDDVCECFEFPYDCQLYAAGADAPALGSCKGCWDEGSPGVCFDQERCTTACGEVVMCDSDDLLQFTDTGTFPLEVADCSGCPESSECVQPTMCGAFCGT